MNPTAALASTTFRAYTLVVLGLLLFGGGMLWQVSRSGRGGASLWATYRGWLVIAPLMLLTIFAGRAAVIVVFTTISVFAFKEFARATGLYRDWTLCGASYAMIVAVGVVTL